MSRVISRWWLPLLTVVAILALTLSASAVVTLVLQSQHREQERVTADLRACERGNLFRQQVIDIGTAGAQLDEDILDGIYGFAGLTPDEEAAVRQILAPAFARFDRAVAEVELTDCHTAVRGA